MNLSEPFIRRPIMTTLIMAAIVLLGVMAYTLMPVSNLPDVNYPTINVKVPFPGASPETMANTVASPLEKEFMTIPGVDTVTSTNTLGNTSIVLQFEVSKSMDDAAVDVIEAISRARTKLPPDLPNEPSFEKVNPSDTPIIYIVLRSETMPQWDLYTYANTFIGQRISTLEGVAQVFTYGSPFAVRVQVDPGKLATRGITLNEVSTALSQGNTNLPTGVLDGAVKTLTILANGQLQKGSAYQPLIVAYRNNAPVRIRDLGNAIDSLQNDRISFRFADKNINQASVVLAVRRQPSANTVKVSDAINKLLPNLAKQLPASITLQVVFDRAESIRNSLDEVKFTLVLALFLVVAVIFLYLGKIADTIIPSLVMPMSIIATLAIIYPLGFTINNLTLLAFTLAIGFIVDDAIVVLENIVRRVEEGDNPWHAALEGSKQISFTILSMTISLAAVFIPMLFMGGLIGKIFREFSITLMIVTLVSGVISLTLTPMLCSRFIPTRDKLHQGKISAFSQRFNDTMLGYYKPALSWMLDHRKTALVIGAVCVILTGVLFKILPTDFIPDEDIGFIIAYSQAEQGTSSDRMKNYQDEMIKVFQSDPNVNVVVSLASYQSYRDGINFIRLKPQSERMSINDVMKRLYMNLGQIPGVNNFLKNVPLIDLSIGSQNKGPYQYTMEGLNPNELYQAGDALFSKMKQDPMFLGVNTDLEIKTPQLNIEVLRDQASALGVTAEDIETALLLAYSGNRVSRIQTPIDQYDVILELEKKYQGQVKYLDQIYVRSKTTQDLVPLRSVAKWSEGVGPNSINHISQFPAITISFSVAPGIPLSTALDRVKKLAEDSFPPSVSGNAKGAAETFESALKSANWLLVLAVLAIYIVLGILYESFIHPLTILSTLPPAIAGALLTLVIFGMPLSLYAYLGIVLLVGIVKKNGIMMVDYALEYRRRGHEDPTHAIYHASTVRFRPIMMTTLAAIFGAIPIALGVGIGAESRRPLGVVIIGGLLVSQMITLFITPVIYTYLDKWNTKFTPKEDWDEEQAEQTKLP